MNRIESIVVVFIIAFCFLVPRETHGQEDTLISFARSSYGENSLIVPEVRYQKGRWINLYNQQQKWGDNEIGVDWHWVNTDGVSECVVRGNDVGEDYFDESPGWGTEWKGLVREYDTCEGGTKGKFMTTPMRWVPFEKLNRDKNPEDSTVLAMLNQLAKEQIDITIDSLTASSDSLRYGFLKSFSSKQDETRYILQTSHPLNGVMISYVFGLRRYYAPFSPPRSYESCNAISWGGYVMKENNEVDVYIDTATTSIPLAPCFEDKTGLYYVPGAYFVIDDHRFISAGTHLFGADNPPMILELKDLSAVNQYSLWE